MSLDEILCEYVLHVASKELGVRDAVDAAVDLGILDSLGNILNTYDLAGSTRHEIGYGARASVEVVD